MKKNKLFVCVGMFFFMTHSYSQVGINTVAPHAQLEIASSSLTSPTNIDGLIIPRVQVFPSSGLTANQQSMLVYLTSASGVNQPGFYYYNHPTLSWIPIGSGSSSWSLVGNSGTVVDTNFIGTTDNKDLVFKRFSLNAGRIGVYNTSFGLRSLNAIMDTAEPGIRNTAIGINALEKNTTGYSNTAVGAHALRENIIGYRNTAVGLFALSSLKKGGYNTAVGSEALTFADSADYNTAVGLKALHYTTKGHQNSAFGCNALYNNQTGSSNCAFGYIALNANLTGNENTAVGLESGRRFTTGSYNTSIGSNSLSNLISGSNNIAIGYNAQVANATGSNQVRFGNANITSAEIQVAWTITSDMRWKDNVNKSDLGLNFIKSLSPVSYTRKNDNTQRLEYGLIAQELELALKKAGVINSGIINKDDAGMYSVRYNDLISIAITAIQEQQQIIEEEKVKSQKLQDKVAIMERKLLAIEAKLSKGDSELAENK